MSYQTAFEPDDADEPYVSFFERGDGIPSRTVLARAEVFDEERFDDELKLREDPHLWTRLLQKYDATRIPEALATKQRRPDSITDDPGRVLEYELMEIERLCERFPELEEHRDKREAQAHFRYGRQQLLAGDRQAARDAFREVKEAGFADERLWACLAISFLPTGAPQAYHLLETLNEVRK